MYKALKSSSCTTTHGKLDDVATINCAMRSAIIMIINQNCENGMAYLILMHGCNVLIMMYVCHSDSNNDVLHSQQGNQRWQIPRPTTCQFLATFTPLKSKILIFFRDVISLLARVFILLIDTANQEVPMKNIWKKLSVQFLRYAIELLHVKRRTRHKWR